jgi:hypothetical protein
VVRAILYGRRGENCPTHVQGWVFKMKINYGLQQLFEIEELEDKC